MKMKDLVKFLKKNYNDNEELWWQIYRKRDINKDINDVDWKYAILQMSEETRSITELLQMYVDESKSQRGVKK